MTYWLHNGLRTIEGGWTDRQNFNEVQTMLIALTNARRHSHSHEKFLQAKFLSVWLQNSKWKKKCRQDLLLVKVCELWGGPKHLPSLRQSHNLFGRHIHRVYDGGRNLQSLRIFCVLEAFRRDHLQFSRFLEVFFWHSVGAVPSDPIDWDLCLDLRVRLDRELMRLSWYWEIVDIPFFNVDAKRGDMTLEFQLLLHSHFRKWATDDVGSRHGFGLYGPNRLPWKEHFRENPDLDTWPDYDRNLGDLLRESGGRLYRFSSDVVLRTYFDSPLSVAATEQLFAWRRRAKRRIHTRRLVLAFVRVANWRRV
jgi:hypothetical protein